MSRGFVLLATLAWVLLLAAPGEAVTTRRVPEDFPTLRAAIAGSEGGDTIVVAPGVYRESILLTEAKGDGLMLRSVEGSAKTTIAYGDSADPNLAVVTIQRCSKSTQIIGFTIDGRGDAQRGILATSDSQPVLEDVLVSGCEHAIAAHKNAAPVLRKVAATGSRTAGLFVEDASVDAEDCSFTSGQKFGVYAIDASPPVRLRNVTATDNAAVGIQLLASEATIEGGVVAKNGDVGILVQGGSGEITDVTIEGHANVGVVMERSSVRLRRCTIRDNEFGAVASISGQPNVAQCTFEENRAVHLAIEGEANPIVGGSVENANRLLGEAIRIQSSSTAVVDATYNFWGVACHPDEIFRLTGLSKLRTSPWMSPDLTKSFDDCSAAEAYFASWEVRRLAPPVDPKRVEGSEELDRRSRR